jgi:peptidyl-prolyl cis-trans isomerase C
MMVEVAGAEIHGETVYREAQYHPAASWEIACHEATRALVIRELLLAQAEFHGLCTTRQLDERDAQSVISGLLETEISLSQVCENECRAFYEAHPERFAAPQLMEASHILFAAPPQDPERGSTRLRAQRVLDELLQRPERFERLAKKHSACPSASSGGHLGQLGLGDTLPVFEAALAELEPGQIAPRLVETRHGFHVVLLNQRSEGRTLPFDAVHQRIRSYLSERAWRRAFRSYICDLAEQFGVRGFDLAALSPRSVDTAAGLNVLNSATTVPNGTPGRGQTSRPSPRRLPLIP